MENENKSTKEVLICFGDRKRPVKFVTSENDPDEELPSLTAAAKAAFSDILERENTQQLILQIKSERWNGEFVDVLANGNTIPDNSVLQMYLGETEKSRQEVGNSVLYQYPHFVCDFKFMCEYFEYATIILLYIASIVYLHYNYDN